MNQRERLADARSGYAVGPVLERGILRVTGKDRQDFLHRLCTQKIAGLGPGEATYAAFLDVKGHVVGEGAVLVRPDEILLDVDPAAAEATRSHLDRYIVMDDVVVEDISDALRVLPVLGAAGVARAAGATPIFAENPRRGAPAVDLYLAAPEARRAALVADGATALDESDLEALRILAGVPRYGAEMDASRLVLEAGITKSAIHFQKGCYLGQEIVLRGTVRGHLQRGLVQLALPSGAGPGERLLAAGQEVGIVTSASDTPEGRVGLGYLRRAHWKEGERVETSHGEATVRRVLVQDGAC